MPKTPMSREEVDRFRNRILDVALDIILKQGFDSLSVRKIASRLGVTATTIYNYYSCKDELNLMIRVRGFETLREMLAARADQADDIEGRLESMVGAYVDFGLSYPGYYDLMFNLHTPKYLDYVGTQMEATAFFEKETALKCLALFSDPIGVYLGVGDAKVRGYIQYALMKYWADLHGLITLCNSRLFHEVISDVESFVEIRIREVVSEVLRIKERVDRGEPLSDLLPKRSDLRLEENEPGESS